MYSLYFNIKTRAAQYGKHKYFGEINSRNKFQFHAIVGERLAAIGGNLSFFEPSPLEKVAFVEPQAKQRTDEESRGFYLFAQCKFGIALSLFYLPANQDARQSSPHQSPTVTASP